jgi:hypothetical protein
VKHQKVKYLKWKHLLKIQPKVNTRGVKVPSNFYYKGYIMNNTEKANLLEALQKGQVTVTFTKIDTGDVRVMPCTLNPEMLKANGVKTEINYTSNSMEAFPVWSLDKNAWRSFRLDTVEGWEVL